MQEMKDSKGRRLTRHSETCWQESERRTQSCSSCHCCTHSCVTTIKIHLCQQTRRLKKTFCFKQNELWPSQTCVITSVICRKQSWVKFSLVMFLVSGSKNACRWMTAHTLCVVCCCQACLKQEQTSLQQEPIECMSVRNVRLQSSWTLAEMIEFDKA